MNASSHSKVKTAAIAANLAGLNDFLTIAREAHVRRHTHLPKAGNATAPSVQCSTSIPSWTTPWRCIGQL
jgi:hypothetical protein